MELLCIKDVYSGKPNRELKFKAGKTYQAEFFGKTGLFSRDEQDDPHTIADGDGRRFLDIHFEPTDEE